VAVVNTITFKSNDDFCSILDNLSKDLGESRSQVIRSAVIYYNDLIEKRKLRESFKNASLKTREDSIKIEREFEDTLSDGLS
jgi:metal-responsive CopG/Arc/MetJ family transcriptional regulator